MAYNNREWDNGKEYAAEDAWYGPAGSDSQRGTVRSRVGESDYGDGKRRKYNDGGYDTTQTWEEASWDTNSYSREERSSRGGFGAGVGAGAGAGGFHGGKKRLVPSEPSPHVIFLGLDPDFSEADLQAYLSSHGFTIQTVTIIRERSTGQSKGFGFAQFSSIEQARTFVDPSFPFIQVPPPASHGASATAAFYKALETGVPHNGRRVKIDYSQSASPGDKGRFGRGQVNDGTRDIGNAQAPVLLFRGLDPLSGVQAIAQAMKTSSGLHREGAKGMKRIILIKDKVTMASWGFAFVEFVDVQSASAVLAATMSIQLHPNGFRISDRPVAASFAHPYSFQPLADVMLRDDASIPSSLNLGGVEGTWARYWDEASTAAVLEFEVEQPVEQSQPQAKEKKEKKKKHLESNLTTPAAASALPVSDKPVTLSFKAKTNVDAATSASAKPTTLPMGFSAADDADADAEQAGDEADTTNKEAQVTASKKVAPMIASKKTVNNINKWNQVQEELKPGAPSSAVPITVAPSASTAVIVEPKAKSTPPVPEEAEFEFSDMNKITCLLCSRQFKSLDQLRRHNKESDLHKKNFKDPNLREVAREKAEAAKASTSTSAATSQPKYRDRASERRIMHNQPDVPLPELTEDKRKPRRFAEGPPPPLSPPPAPVNPGKDEKNVGNKLLKMMGWKEGSGLGVDGEGRVDPIQTAIYASGVGLGASKGKEVGKYQDGYSGYVHMAQDAARERYES